MRFILASMSETRAVMLRNAGIPVEGVGAGVDEDAVKEAYRAEAAPARDVADALAEMKAKRVGARNPGSLTLGADQVLEFEGRIFDKPRDRTECREGLLQMRGKMHKLLSAAVICDGPDPVWRHVGTASLTMRPFTPAFLDAYLDAEGDAVLSTVGGYRIEGLGAQLFSRVSGDYFSILGLPLLEVLGFLRARGVLVE